MTKKIDVFAHVLLPDFYRQMLEIEPRLPELFPFIQHPHLRDLELRRSFWDGQTQQIISFVNVNPEDYVSPEMAAVLCRQANAERPNRFYFFEVYADEAAYLSHRETAHFQAYIKGTAALVQDKLLLDLQNSTAISQGQLKGYKS